MPLYIGTIVTENEILSNACVKNWYFFSSGKTNKLNLVRNVSNEMFDTMRLLPEEYPTTDGQTYYLIGVKNRNNSIALYGLFDHPFLERLNYYGFKNHQIIVL